jgi:hypothetical protein
MKLTLKQTKCLDYLEDKTTKEIVFGGGAGGGKSLVGCYWISKSALKYAGSRWLIGRSELKNLKATTLVTLFEVFKMQGLQEGTHYRYNAIDSHIKFFNGSLILLKDLKYYPSDPLFDSLGSLEISGAFIDEVAQISKKAWSIVRSRCRYKLDEFNIIPKVLGTCNPNKGFAYHLFYKPNNLNELPDTRKFIQSLVYDNPNISAHYIDSLKSLDTADKARLLDGKWEYEENEDQLISFESITNYFTNSFVKKDVNRKRVTIDVARKGRDNSIIRLWYGYACVKRICIPVCTITELAKVCKDLCNKENIPMSGVVADEDGVGGGLVDILRCQGFINGSQPIQTRRSMQDGRRDIIGANYVNLKTQCSYLIAEKIQKNELYEFIEDSDLINSITEEMEWVRSKDKDRDGKLKLIGKDIIKNEIGRSPDDWDSIMMLGYFELSRAVITV